MRYLPIILLVSFLSCSARVLDFVETDFDGFVNQKMADNKEEQKSFQGYHADLTQKIKEASTDEQVRTRKYLYECGETALAKTDKKKHDKLNKLLYTKEYNDPIYDEEKAQAREYVYWTGAFEEYQQQRHGSPALEPHNVAQNETKSSKFLNQAKSYMTKATQKVGNWFKKWRRS